MGVLKIISQLNKKMIKIEEQLKNIKSVNLVNKDIKNVKNSINNFLEKPISRFNCKLILSAPLKESIDNYINSISKRINQESIKVVWLPKKKSRITLLKSPHVNKRAKEHFEINNYKAILIFSSNKQFERTNLLFLQKPAFVQIKTVWSVLKK